MCLAVDCRRILWHRKSVQQADFSNFLPHEVTDKVKHLFDHIAALNAKILKLDTDFQHVLKEHKRLVEENTHLLIENKRVFSENEGLFSENKKLLKRIENLEDVKKKP